MKGNTKKIAGAIARELGSDVLEIKPKDPVKAEKFMTYYWSGEKNVPEKTVDIEDPEHNWMDYDLIVIGTPVWAWAPAPPVHSYMTKEMIEGKKIAIFSTSEGDTGKTFKKMKQHLNGNKIIAWMDFLSEDPLDIIDSKKKAIEWARSIKKRFDS